MGAGKKMNNSQNIYDYVQKSRIAISTVLFYALIVVAMFLLSYDLNFMPSSSTHHQTLDQKQNPKTITSSIFESGEDNEAENEEEDPLVPPPGMTRAERMSWFRKQLPKLEILKSSNSSSLFHDRVLRFLNQNCSTVFHAIWLSPAKSFSKREFMTFDTLLTVHPQGCLLILSGSLESELGNNILKPLLDRGFKVLAIAPDLPYLVENTPAQAWLEKIRSGKSDPGSIPLSQNLSNLMRLAMLYKYGGVYLDIDLVILRDFSALRNAIVAQNVNPVTKKWMRLNNAVMIFDMYHPILLEFLEEFASTYDGNIWGYNGPYMVSRVVQRVRGTAGYYNFTILPLTTFYPVNWIKIPDFYMKPKTDGGLALVDRLVELLYGGKTYALHLWNKRTRKLDIEEGSVISRLYIDHCVVCYDITKT